MALGRHHPLTRRSGGGARRDRGVDPTGTRLDRVACCRRGVRHENREVAPPNVTPHVMASEPAPRPNVPQRIRAWSASPALYPCCCTVSPAGPARGAVRTGRTVRHVRGRPVHDAVPTVPSTSRRRRPLDTTARAPSRRPVRWVGRYRPRTGVPWPAEVRPCPTPRGPPAERRAGRPHVRVGARLAYTYTQVLILVQQLATDHVSIRVMFQYES